jgi:hypothetical protein
MRHAVVGALLLAAVSTLGDFVWAGLGLRHRVVYGLAHGAILFLCMGAYFGSLQNKTAVSAVYGAAIGLAAAGSFYVLAPLVGYSAMFLVWAFVWIALAFLVNGRRARRDTLLRGVAAMAGSGAGFYLISGIWRPFDPQGWDYAVHFVSWAIAYLPAFLALLYGRARQDVRT